MPKVTVPTLLVHPTADTEIRVWQAKEIVDDAGADDVTYVEMKGAPHYLEGHRPEALAIVADWLAPRYPVVGVVDERTAQMAVRSLTRTG